MTNTTISDPWYSLPYRQGEFEENLAKCPRGDGEPVTVDPWLGTYKDVGIPAKKVSPPRAQREDPASEDSTYRYKSFNKRLRKMDN